MSQYLSKMPNFIPTLKCIPDCISKSVLGRLRTLKYHVNYSSSHIVLFCHVNIQIVKSSYTFLFTLSFVFVFFCIFVIFLRRHRVVFFVSLFPLFELSCDILECCQ